MSFFKKILNYIRAIFCRIDGNCKIKRNHLNRKNNNRIIVVFVCQYLPSWEKMRHLYIAMTADSRFEPKVLCVPSQLNNAENDTFNELKKRGCESLINALENENSFVSLSKIPFDYIFYDRPYNNYLPKEYKAKTAANFGAVSLHPYGISLSKKLHDSLLFKDFVSYVSFYFGDTFESTERFKSLFVGKSKYKSAIYLGYLGIENVYSQKNILTDIWNYHNGIKKVIWAPRWSVDSFGGGSNFFDFKDKIIEMSTKTNISLIIRPHPLMFENFYKSGLMTKLEIEQYLKKVLNCPNTKLDSDSNYIPTFWNSDILISDFSSIIIEYILTGKPVIYCTSNINWDLFEFAEKLFNCCYIAKSFEDVQLFVSELIKGKDPLKKKREELIKNYLLLDSKPSEAFCEFLFGNYTGIKKEF